MRAHDVPAVPITHRGPLLASPVGTQADLKEALVVTAFFLGFVAGAIVTVAAQMVWWWFAP